MGNEILHGIVERQIKVYGDLLDRIANEVRQAGLRELADKIQFYKINYGLGHYRLDSIVLPRIIQKPYINQHEALKEVLLVLKSNRGKKLSPLQIFGFMTGNMSPHVWSEVRAQLKHEDGVKTEGHSQSKVYWME